MNFTVEISAPVKQVFEAIADLPNYGRWLPPSGLYAGKTEPLEVPIRLGTRYEDRATRGTTLSGTITAFDPPHTIGFHQSTRQVLGTLAVDIAYQLQPIEGGTRLHRTTEPSYTGVLSVFGPLIARSIRSENLRTLQALKRYLEANPG